MEPRDHALFNAALPGLPEMSGLRSRLSNSVRQILSSKSDKPAAPSSSCPPTVTIPLYIYPAPGAWDPLHTAIANNPSISFHIIINPNNGPGAAVPDANYIAEVARLNSQANTTLFGYVHVTWGRRALQDVLADISTWSAWAGFPDADIHVDGIFVDEAPSDTAYFGYMRDARRHATQAFADKKALVWTNPGVPVDAAFYAEADLVNSCENDYRTWSSQQDTAATPDVLRAKSTIMLHNYHGSPAQLRNDADRLRRAGYRAFLISTDSNYTSFSRMWKEYVATMVT